MNDTYHLESIILTTLVGIESNFREILQNLISILSPLYWNLAREVDNGKNFLSLCNGYFRRDTNVYFENGDLLTISEISKGIDNYNNLDYDIFINGKSPHGTNTNFIQFTPYIETILNTGPDYCSKMNITSTFYSTKHQHHYGDDDELHLILNLFEIFLLAFIIFEHTLLFIITFSSSSTQQQNQEQRQHQLQENKSKLKSTTSFPIFLLRSCVNRNWIRAFSFSNIFLAIVYLTSLIIKRYNNNKLLHSGSITYLSISITLLTQIFQNFFTFQNFILSICIVHFFFTHCRLYLSQIQTAQHLPYRPKQIILNTHKNIILIVSVSLALIFGYNFIFYMPKHSLTTALFPLLLINVLILPLLNILVILTCIIDVCLAFYIKCKKRQQCQYLDIRTYLQSKTCIKCFNHILQEYPTVLVDIDPYSTLQSKFLASDTNNNRSPNSTRQSLQQLTPPRQSSSYEYLPMTVTPKTNISSIPTSYVKLKPRTSYPFQTDKPIIKNRSHTDCEILCDTSHTTTIDIQKSTQNYLSSTTQIPLTTTTTISHSSSLAPLLTINKDQLSCRLCYYYLTIFTLKYALLCLPMNILDMWPYILQLKRLIFTGSHLDPVTEPSTASSVSISDDHIYTSICRCLFLLARLGDGLLLIKVTFSIINYLPCWCQLNWCKQNNDELNESNEHLSCDEDCPPSDLIHKKPSNYRHRRRHSPRRYKIKIRFESLYIPHEQKLTWTIEKATVVKNDQREKCPTGFQRDYQQYCKDIDECSLNSPCSHRCINTMGGYYCLCPDGFELGYDLKTCYDINECAVREKYCDQEKKDCFNTFGSFKCYDKCERGLRRVNDEHYCV
ncbi:unnamed protein product, partial [Didymodactylos carnosus]